MNHLRHSRLTPDEENFIGAVLWEEGHLVKGPATLATQKHGLSILRCLETANRLSANFQGAALNRLTEGPCPPTAWPWPGKSDKDVLQLLWDRLAATRDVVEEPIAEQR
jgi:hypothetical protein